MVLRLALDHNFPLPVVTALRPSIAGVSLESVSEIDARLPLADDWQVILALSQKGYDGLVTQDAKMLNLAKELLVMEQTKLTVIAIESTGHHPVAATGILLAHLDRLRLRIDRLRPQVWRLNVKLGSSEHPGTYLNKVAKHSHVSPADLRRDHSLSAAEMTLDPLANIVVPSGGATPPP